MEIMAIVIIHKLYNSSKSLDLIKIDLITNV